MNRRMMSAVALAAAAGIGAAAPAAQAATAVDVELSLLVDVSGSVNSTEFSLQRDGYVSAFNSAAVQNAILSTANGRLGKVAAQLVYWSSAGQQAVSVGWTLLDSAASISSFASAIAASGRPFSNLTGIGSAIRFGADQINGNDFDGTKQVIDVSGDGENNDGITALDGVAYALANGVDRVNGISIGDDSLFDYYKNNVIGGTNAFALKAADFSTFSTAIQRKLEAEITGGNPDPVPLPAAGWMLLSGFGALAVARRRRRA